MQKIQTIGHIGQDAKINEYNGRKAISFSVAANRKYVDSNGVTHEQSTWYSCTKWVGEGRSTELAKYLTSGTKVFIEGIPSVSIWTNKEGKPVANLNVDVREIELLSSKKDEQSQTPPQEDQGFKPNDNFDNEKQDLPFN